MAGITKVERARRNGYQQALTVYAEERYVDRPIYRSRAESLAHDEGFHMGVMDRGFMAQGLLPDGLYKLETERGGAQWLL